MNKPERENKNDGMRRFNARFTRAHRERISALSERYYQETRRRLSRAELVRMLVESRLNSLVDTMPLAEQLPSLPRTRGTPAPIKRKPLSVRLVDAISGHPDEVFTPARLAKLLGDTSTDSVRNALLRIAGMKRIEKVGAGQYRARPRTEP